LPGFICTWAISLHSELVASWINGGDMSQASVGGMLFSTVFALGSGSIASTVRWILLDSLHHWTGVRKRQWDYRQLQATHDDVSWPTVFL
jgi:hypothetical protein